MAINKIKGVMLESNLLLDGNNLAVETDILFIDPVNSKIGIKTVTPHIDSALTVVGNTRLGNIRISTDEILLDTGTTLNFQLAGVDVNFNGSRLKGINDPADAQDAVSLTFLETALAPHNTDNIYSGNSTLTILKVVDDTTLDFKPNNILKLQLTDTTASLSLDTTITGTLAVTSTSTLDDVFISTNSVSTTAASGLGLQLTSDSGIINVTGSMIVSTTTANKILFSNASNEVASTTNLTYDGTNLVLIGQATFDDVVINGNTINSTTGLTLSTTNLALTGTTGVTLTANTTNDITMNLTDGVVAMETTTSLKIPVGTTLQRPGTPEAGYIRFNTLTSTAEIYNGVSWSGFAADFAGITVQDITGDNSTTVFALTGDGTTESIIVSINGIVQEPTVAYTVAGTNITFAAAPLTTDDVSIRFLSALTTINAISDGTDNTVVEVIAGEIFLDIDGTNAMKVDATTIEVALPINPDADLGSDLGTALLRFNNLYVNQINGVAADIAENFMGDAEYEPGTVLVIGGVNDVTISTSADESNVAGIVSTQPAYLLNSTSEIPNAIALAGRVPCKVLGPINKGDLLATSNVAGHAQRYINDGIYRPGVLLGKAMESTAAETDTISVLVTLM